MEAPCRRVGDYVEKVTESVVNGVKYKTVICTIDSSPFIDTLHYEDGRLYMISTDWKRRFSPTRGQTK